MKLTLNQVTVNVTDIERAFRFYRELGLIPIVKSDHYSRFIVPGNEATFSIHIADRVESTTTVFFETDDIDATYKQLSEKGFSFEEPPKDQKWDWREATLFDPDNNRICIYSAGSVRVNPDWRIESSKDKHWLTETYFDHWLSKYKLAWEKREPASATDLFSQDALYYETPFNPPAHGRREIMKYWQNVPKGQQDIQFDYSPINVFNNIGYCRWSASFVRAESNRKVELDGIFQVTFDSSGKCVEFKEWWHRQETE